jgi:hypothetical protein
MELRIQLGEVIIVRGPSRLRNVLLESMEVARLML